MPISDLDHKIATAIRAHMSWRVHLQNAITRHEAISPDISNDRLCELGQWIAALQAEYGDTWEWQYLNTTHAAFHLAAGECAQMIEDGTKDKAIQSIRDGAYALASSKILDALIRLREHMAAAPH